MALSTKRYARAVGPRLDDQRLLAQGEGMEIPVFTIVALSVVLITVLVYVITQNRPEKSSAEQEQDFLDQSC